MYQSNFYTLQIAGSLKIFVSKKEDSLEFVIDFNDLFIKERGVLIFDKDKAKYFFEERQCKLYDIYVDFVEMDAINNPDGKK